MDDCSSDKTVEIANQFGHKIIRLDKNSGPANARNIGADIASGDILFFADSDVEFLPDTLNETARIFEDPDIKVVTGIYSKEPANKGMAALYKALFMYYHFTKAKIENYNIFSSSCGAIRKDAFKQVGGFNSTIKWGMDLENDEFGYRINKTYTNPVITQIQVKHNFPTFKKLLLTMFRRTFFWTFYFLKRKRFDKTITTPIMGISNGISPFIIFSSILGILNKAFLILTGALTLFYISTYLGFYIFVLKESKIKQFLPLLVISFFVSVTVGAAAILAFITRTIVLTGLLKDKYELEAIS